MNKETLGIVKALAEVFFGNGYNRKEGKHSLEYWNVNTEEIGEHCRQCSIFKREGCDEFFLNTVKIGEQWYVRVCQHTYYDELGEYTGTNVLLLIPIANINRLTDYEFEKCAQLIESVCFPDLYD